jgi:glycosyltransferase involved in cell wall biosynthesis
MNKIENKLSIIIPLYNLGKYLENCLKSIYNNESTLNFNIIIVDDCSTDDSYETAKALCEKLEDTPGFRQTTLTQTPKNLHLSGVRNFGIERADGNLIICLDADDMIPPNYIEENYQNMTDNNVDVSYTNSQCFGTSSQLFNWPEYDEEILKQSPFINCSAMYKKEIWINQGYDERMKLGWEDYDFWLHAAKRRYKFKKCNETYLAYRQSDTSMINSTNEKKNQIKIREHLRKKHYAFYKG